LGSEPYHCPSIKRRNNMADTTSKEHSIGGRTITVLVRKTLDAASNYDAEDVLSEDDDSNEGTCWTFTGVGKSKGAGGYITKAVALCSTTGLTPRLTLYLFKNTPTSELDDNAANTAVIAGDRDNYIGRIDFPAMEDLGGYSEALATPNTAGNLPLAFNCDADDNSLYGVLVTRDAISGEAASMTMTIKLTSEIE
jgi:hypothetical protein